MSPRNLHPGGLRLLMTVDAVGGVWRYAMDLAAGLREKGIETLFVGLGPKPTGDRMREADAIGRLVWLEEPLDWMVADRSALGRVPEAIGALALRDGVDLVHLNVPSQLAGFDMPLPVVVVSHSCVPTWFAAVRGHGVPEDWKWQLDLNKRGFDRADVVLAPSHSHANMLVEAYGPIDRLQVVPNASRLAPHGVEKKDFVFAAARWWDDGKNGAVLDAAAQHSDWRIVMAGPNRGPAGQYRPLDNAAHCGELPHPETMSLMAEAAIVVSPSIYEPFGLAALEAARSGCALVLADIPTYRELWEGAALFADPHDPIAFANAINRLSQNGPLRTLLGERARVRSQDFTTQAQAKAMSRIYERLLSTSDARDENGDFMKFIFYTHSLISDWNHGNAHFLRGVMRDLIRRGHEALALEPCDAWSRINLLQEQGPSPIEKFRATFPELRSQIHDADFDHEVAIADADVVIVHEWNEPALVERIGRARRNGGRFTLLFHDTHHRAVSARGEIAGLQLDDYDGVLVFGEALRQRYLAAGWGGAVFCWHEAADDTLFRPASEIDKTGDLIWIGNWGDDERSAEIMEFFVQPARALGLNATVRGVRYPPHALAALKQAGIAYGGWIANAEVPLAFARHKATVHIPRRPYLQSLPGIPTIRVFEALACGIPLICAPWNDTEHLFSPGKDYLVAPNGAEMTRLLREILSDPGLSAALIEAGLETIRARHTCRHRVDELLAILSSRGTERVTKKVDAEETAQ